MDAKTFWSKIQKSEGCWKWTGARDVRGYGNVLWGDRTQKAHRVSWILENGQEIPKGMIICHKCDNPSCVRPDHLFLGTYYDNRLDMIFKGRSGPSPDYRGEKHPRTDLTNNDVRNIRVLISMGVGYGWIKKLYGIGGRTISAIKTGREWKCITDTDGLQGKLDFINSRAISQQNNSILTTEKVLEIKTMIVHGIPGAVIAKKYGVDKMTISNIKNGKTWRQVSIA